MSDSICQINGAFFNAYHAQVPAEVLQPGVLRATVPPHPPGNVRLAVSLGDGIPRSSLLPFEYRVPPLSVQEDG